MRIHRHRQPVSPAGTLRDELPRSNPPRKRASRGCSGEHGSPSASRPHLAFVTQYTHVPSSPPCAVSQAPCARDDKKGVAKCEVACTRSSSSRDGVSKFHPTRQRQRHPAAAAVGAIPPSATVSPEAATGYAIPLRNLEKCQFSGLTVFRFTGARGAGRRAKRFPQGGNRARGRATFRSVWKRARARLLRSDANWTRHRRVARRTLGLLLPEDERGLAPICGPRHKTRFQCRSCRPRLAGTSRRAEFHSQRPPLARYFRRRVILRSNSAALTIHTRIVHFPRERKNKGNGENMGDASLILSRFFTVSALQLRALR